MKNRIYLALGIVGIIGLVAMQWAILFNAPKQAYKTRALANTIDAGGKTIITAAADTYVSSSRPAVNYGSESRLQTERRPNKTTYIKFDLSSYKSAQITAVYLKIKSRSSSKNQTISLVPDTSWGEYSLTYNNRPQISQNLTSFTAKSDTWNEIAIPANQIQPYMGKSFTLSIADPDGDEASYYSRETTSPPQLLLSLVYPNLIINSPQDGASVGQNFDMQYSATNWDLGITNNKFAKIYIDGKEEGSSYQSPVQFRGISPGEHLIELSLSNMEGHEIGVKSGIKVVVIGEISDSVNPSIKITAPNNDSFVSSGFDVKYETANWTNGGQTGNHVQIYVNDVDRGPVLMPYAPFSGLPTGSYKITLKLVDGNNNPLGPEDTIQVKIPSIKITSPMVGYAVPPNFDVKFTTYNWAYSPTDKRIAKVFVDGKEAGPLVLENYAPFNGMTPGVHVIRLELTENGASLYGSTVYDEVMVLVQ